ncbi:hypothetical protein IFM89_021539 [Coptis chinensis]|uniref:Retrotransposon gag domain-containing protein n=1 Tax=Coptis chinensis TaxID=261450 RepID=A0A835IBI3_9MAGN|nr:hypothetical protein IFM89_021539 [Coptis chinensis]
MSQKRRHHLRSHASSSTQNHITPIVECLGLGGIYLRAGSVVYAIVIGESVSRRSQYPKEQSLSVPRYSSAAKIDLERDMQCSRSLVLQREQYIPAQDNRRFDRSPGGSDSSESEYNGSRNTHRRTNGGYQMVGDRSGSQQWARSHRTGALHNSVGGYTRTRELSPRRAEANFRQHRQDSVELGWSPERRNRTHRVGTNNVALQENSDNLNEQRVQELIRTAMDSKATREDKRHKLEIKGPEESPFIDEIRDYISPGSFKQPSVPTYDDVDGCPDEHLMKYRSSMALFNNNDALMCIMFQATLSGEALTWFNELHPHSIHTFPQLADKFSKHYRYNRKTIKGYGTLFNLHMEKGESIRDLVENFVVSAQGERYATVQEDSKYKQQGDFSSDRGKQEQQQCDKDRKKHNKDAKTGISQSQKQDGHPSKDLTLPELSISLSELYDKLKGKISKLFPMKLDTEGRRNKSKKCKYHNDFDHTLNHCYAFIKKEISRMADGGQLKEYLKGSQKLAHVNMIEHDVIVVCHAQATVCSSNRERKWNMKRKIQKIGSWNHINSINFKSGFYVETIVEGGLTFTEEDE